MAKTEVTFNPIFYESDRKQNKKKALRHLKKQKREKERERLELKNFIKKIGRIFWVFVLNSG